jgi:hypothetical protein
MRTGLIVVAVFALAVLGLHIWFVQNAKNVLKQIVAEQSHGKLKLELSQLRFEFLTNKLQIRVADLQSTDTVSQPISYHVRFRKLTVTVHSFWPLLFQHKLLLDSIKLHDPEIEVFQWRKDTTLKSNKEDLTVPQQMGRLYNSMLDALEAFGIRRISIENGKLSLVNKMIPDIKPVVVSNINFDLLRARERIGKRDEYKKDEQSVSLSTRDQVIDLPSGRHRLSFKTFNLELFQKRMELDSCTVTALAKGATKSSYTLFFKKLLLIGVDFEAMYRYNVIRADSVYCDNPTFDIHLVTTRKQVGEKKKEAPDLEEVVRDLSGDLDLAFIGVKDAGIHINITGDKERSLFNSNKDNFEMYGLRINADSTSPVVVKRFDMLVRDYHLYNADSSTAYSFDSIHFRDNKIVLNNFSVLTEPTKYKLRNGRDFRIPYFELTGLDWYELIFQQNISAREAVLYEPVIRFRKNMRSPHRTKGSLFGSLQTLDSLMTLHKIKIINGQLDLNLGAATSVNVKDLNLSVFSDYLMQSSNQEGLRKAVELLSFSKGVIRIKDITAQLQNFRYTGTNLVHGDRLIVSSKSNSVKAQANDVYITNLLLDDRAERVVLDGLRWGSASIALKMPGAGGKKKTGGNISLKNISGGNTRLELTAPATKISTNLSSLRLGSLVKEGNKPITIDGLSLAGSRLAVQSGALNLKSVAYLLTSNGNSFFENISVEQAKGPDSLTFRSPRIDFSADINSLMQNDVHVYHMDARSPDINIQKWSAQPTDAAQNKKMTIRIDEISAEEPEVNIVAHKNDSTTRIHIPRSNEGWIKARGLRSDNDGMQLAVLSVHNDAATLEKNTGEVIGVEKGRLELDVSSLRLGQKDGKPSWSAQIDRLHLVNPNSVTIGKNASTLHVDQASLGNLNLSSEYLNNITGLLRSNISAWLRTGTGTYKDSNTTMQWFSADYNYGRKAFHLDSFNYHPTRPLDSVLAHSSYQTDYITLHTGALDLSGFDLDAYEKDTAFIVNTMQVSEPVITVFRDKKPPFLSGTVKPLPADMIANIPFPIAVKVVNVSSGKIFYTEKNAKTRAEGTLLLAKVDAQIENIKNRDIQPNDSLSLSIDALLMDSASLRLRVDQSYTDSLNGFVMDLRMRPTTLAFLNPVLAPLSNVMITSGTIDSLQMRAVGMEDFAFGEMNMYYHDLKIKLVKEGDQNQSSFMTKVVSWLANALIVKKNNNGRKGVVYFERLRDRSFFNYIVKIAFSGMSTSIGVKSNRKMLKRYHKKLADSKLPEIQLH